MTATPGLYVLIHFAQAVYSSVSLSLVNGGQHRLEVMSVAYISNQHDYLRLNEAVEASVLHLLFLMFDRSDVNIITISVVCFLTSFCCDNELLIMILFCSSVL